MQRLNAIAIFGLLFVTSAGNACAAEDLRDFSIQSVVQEDKSFNNLIEPADSSDYSITTETNIPALKIQLKCVAQGEESNTGDIQIFMGQANDPKTHQEGVALKLQWNLIKKSTFVPPITADEIKKAAEDPGSNPQKSNLLVRWYKQQGACNEKCSAAFLTAVASSKLPDWRAKLLAAITSILKSDCGSCSLDALFKSL